MSANPNAVLREAAILVAKEEFSRQEGHSIVPAFIMELLRSALASLEKDRPEELRPEVAAFAQAMEERLRANDHKPGWKNDWQLALFDRLIEEAEELHKHLLSVWSNQEEYKSQLLKEAADVGNFAMMIADVMGALSLDRRTPENEGSESSNDRNRVGQGATSKPDCGGAQFSEQSEKVKCALKLARNLHLYCRDQLGVTAEDVAMSLLSEALDELNVPAPSGERVGR